MSPSDIAELISKITDIYEFYADIIILFIGLIGNILLILIFTTLRIFRDNRAVYYLTMESTMDIGLLLALLPSDIVGFILGQNPVCLSLIWCKIQLISAYTCGLWSLFTICFLALDQYLSTHCRQNWRRKSTLKLAYRLMFFNLSIAIFHGILFLVFGEIGSIGCSIYHPIAKIYFTFFYYPILIGIFPFTVSGIFSLLAYRNVRRIIRRQVPLERRRLDQQMTAIALTRVICIIILAAPFLIFSVVELNTSVDINDQIEKAVFNLTSKVVSLLVYTNFAINFYIFLIISPRFRNQVKYFCVKRCCRSFRKLFDHRSTISRNNQVVPTIDPRQTSIS